MPRPAVDFGQGQLANTHVRYDFRMQTEHRGGHGCPLFLFDLFVGAVSKTSGRALMA